MASINDGGPAFPQTVEAYDLVMDRWATQSVGGMSLRDYFAGKAMQGIWSNTDVLQALPDNEEESSIAKMAYQQADEMIAAREVNP